jgi:hypothetical protein
MEGKGKMSKEQPEEGMKSARRSKAKLALRLEALDGNPAGLN